MEKRLNIHEKGQAAMKAIYSQAIYLTKSPVEKSLLHLLEFRISQINGCAFCLDMHSKDLRAEGETEQRLYVLNAWREAPFYTDRERAALAWAEAVTDADVTDEVYAEAIAQFTEQELIDITIATLVINSYNRINIAFPANNVGTYQPGMYKVAAN